MASSWGKYLAPVTIPTGGWDFVFSDGTSRSVTAPAGSYGSILEICAAIEDELILIGGAHQTDTVTVSQAGIVTLDLGNLTNVTWASCSDDLLSLFGFDETETPVGDLITANNQHTYGWYPGNLTFGTSRGIGISSDSEWLATDSISRVVAGDGTARIIGPSRFQYIRTVRYSGVHRNELIDVDRGIRALNERWIYEQIRWYPDRSVGVVNTPGTQGDPGDFENDSDVSYWLVTLAKMAKSSQESYHPDFFSIIITLNGEPD